MNHQVDIGYFQPPGVLLANNDIQFCLDPGEWKVTLYAVIPVQENHDCGQAQFYLMTPSSGRQGHVGHKAVGAVVDDSIQAVEIHVYLEDEDSKTPLQEFTEKVWNIEPPTNPTNPVIISLTATSQSVGEIRLLRIVATKVA